MPEVTSAPAVSLPRICSSELPPEKRGTYQALLEAAVEARDHAYTPSSHYNVGAAVRGGSGRIYAGANMELTCYVDHDEQVAMARALAAGEKQVVALATLGAPEGPAAPEDFEDQTPPCGNCRQAAFDLNPHMAEVEAEGREGFRLYDVSNELPEAYWRERKPFSPPSVGRHFGGPLVEQAFIARSHAYTPKSRSPVGAAVETTDGHIYSGVKVETSSAATQAERMAIASALMEGHKDITRIAIVGGNDPERGEAPPNLSWDSFQALFQLAPSANVLLPDAKGEMVEHTAAEFPEFLHKPAVEVVSGGGSLPHAMRKAAQYLEAGTSLVWILDIAHRRAIVFHHDGEVRTLPEDAYLDGRDVLPGFSVQVRVVLDGDTQA